MKWKQQTYLHGPQPSIVLTTAHLRQKPLSFFVTSNGKPTSVWNTTIDKIKDLCNWRIGNGIVRLGHYYLADYLSFPLQVWPIGGDKYEFLVYWADGQNKLFVKTYHKPRGKRLNNVELAEINKVVRVASDKLRNAIRAAYAEV